jgi:quinol monooxygenase YgiN
MSELHVVATIPAKPEHVESIRAAMEHVAVESRKEDGCLSYDVYESAAVPGTFVTIERWVDQATMDLHLQTPHVAAAIAASEGALTGDVAIHPLVAVAVT